MIFKKFIPSPCSSLILKFIDFGEKMRFPPLVIWALKKNILISYWGMNCRFPIAYPIKERIRKMKNVLKIQCTCCNFAAIAFFLI